MKVLFILIFATTVQAQQISFEQKAFDYFVNEIIAANYQEEKFLYFTGNSETEKSIAGPFAQCYNTDQQFEDFFYQNKKIKSTSIAIDLAQAANIKATKKVKSNKINLELYRSVVNEDEVYVYIKVFKVKHFVDHYLVKISSDSREVIDVCRVNEII